MLYHLQNGKLIAKKSEPVPTPVGFAHILKKEGCTCWEGYQRVPGTKPCAPGSCEKIKKPAAKS